MISEHEIPDLVRATFLLGRLYQSHLSLLMIFDQAKEDAKYVSGLSDVLIQVNSMCSQLGIASPCRVPVDAADAQRTIRNFFSDVQSMADALKKKYSHEIGAILLFASSAEAHRYFHDKVEGDLLSQQVESLTALGSEVGLSQREVEAYLEDPEGQQDSLVDSICTILRGCVQPRLFISYSHEDSKFASSFVARLVAASIPHFQDKKDIGFGEEIGEKVRSGIESATHVVLLLSSHSVNSPWVAYEAGYARRHGIPIVVYLTEPSLPIPTFLGNTRAIASRSDEEQFLAEVRRARCVGG